MMIQKRNISKRSGILAEKATLGKINGGKTFLQKQYNLWNLRDALNTINIREKCYSNKFGEVLSFTCFYNFIKKHKQFVYQRDIPASSRLCEICENACLMGKALERLKDIKGHPTMAHDIVEKYCCNLSKSECTQGRYEDCQFDSVYNQFKDEGNSFGENIATSTDEENEESDVEKDFVMYQRWIREEGKIKKKTICKPKIESEVLWKKMLCL